MPESNSIIIENSIGQHLDSPQDGQYFFTLELNDGTTITEESSKFSIVKQYLDAITGFIIEDKFNHRVYSVDLKTGKFALTYMPVTMDLGLTTIGEDGNIRKVTSEELKYTLVFFRRVKDTNALYEKEDTHEVFSVKSRVICPIFGWQVNYNGENHQRLVQLLPNGEVAILNKK